MNDNRTLTAFGLHAVEAALRHAPSAILECFVRQGGTNAPLDALLVQAAQAGIRVQRVGAETLDKLAGGGNHQGVVIRRRPPASRVFEQWLDELVRPNPLPLVLAIDQIQDPHNLGAALRLADAVGAQGIVLTRDNSVGLTPAVAKVASGALDTVPLIHVTNLVRALGALKEAGLWVIGAAGGEGDSLFELDLNRPLVWVMGAEGSGLRRLTRESCDYLARIPMRGTVDSLNLGTAAAVCLFETLRQRGIR